MCIRDRPTVSQTIIDLEKEYDTVLFERHNKELKITPAGTLLLKRAKEIIALHEGLEQEMKNLHEQRPLKIGATLTIGNTLISELVSLLIKEHPDIDVSVYIDNTRLLEHLSLIHISSDNNTLFHAASPFDELPRRTPLLTFSSHIFFQENRSKASLRGLTKQSGPPSAAP